MPAAVPSSARPPASCSHGAGTGRGARRPVGDAPWGPRHGCRPDSGSLRSPAGRLRASPGPCAARHPPFRILSSRPRERETRIIYTAGDCGARRGSEGGHAAKGTARVVVWWREENQGLERVRDGSWDGTKRPGSAGALEHREHRGGAGSSPGQTSDCHRVTWEHPSPPRGEALGKSQTERSALALSKSGTCGTSDVRPSRDCHLWWGGGRMCKNRGVELNEMNETSGLRPSRVSRVAELRRCRSGHSASPAPASVPSPPNSAPARSLMVGPFAKSSFIEM